LSRDDDSALRWNPCGLGLAPQNRLPDGNCSRWCGDSRRQWRWDPRSGRRESDGRTTNGTISILLGTGGGAFGTQTLITIPGATLPSTPSAVVVGNFGTDVNADIAVTDSANNDVAILRGNGNGTFAAPVTYPTGKTPVALITGNFNAGGIWDLAVVNQTDNAVSILLGRGDGTFAPKTDYPVDVAPAAITTADFNGNGILDLAVANHGNSSGIGGNTVSVLMGNGDGTFKSKTGLCHRKWTRRDHNGGFQC